MAVPELQKHLVTNEVFFFLFTKSTGSSSDGPAL